MKKTLTIDTDMIKQPSTWSAIVVLVTALSTIFAGEPVDMSTAVSFGGTSLSGETASSTSPYVIGGAAVFFLINAFWKKDTQSK